MARSPTHELVSLKDDIESVVAEYNEVDDDEPPFSIAEMVVMAIVCHECHYGEFTTKRDIYRWIIETFGFYREENQDVIAEHYADAAFVDYLSLDLADVEDVLNTYEIPLSAPKDIFAADQHSKVFSVPATAGRVFLREVLFEHPSGVFRFLDLPAELRIRIYEMVFSYQDISPILGENYGRTSETHFNLWKREHEEPGGEEELFALTKSPPLVMVLALLSVNKQISSEAVPYFYRINHFKLDMESLVKWVYNIESSRLKHVRHISIEYKPNPEKWLSRTKAAYSRLTHGSAIRMLEIETNDAKWFRCQVSVRSKVAGMPDQRTPKYSGPGSLPHMQELVGFVRTVEKLSFRGECPRIEDYLRAQMQTKAS